MSSVRKVVTAAAVASAVAAATHAGPGLTALRPVRLRLSPRLSGLGWADHVALTFDDGPDPRSTPAFLDVLASHRVRATFFLLGSMVAGSGSLAAEVAAAGHEIGVHGFDHRYTVARGPAAVRADMARAQEEIAAATGRLPVWYRPPYGVLSAGALLAARRLGLRPVLWSCWGREWAAGATPWSVRENLARGLGPGATVLLHDSDCTSPPGSSGAALAALPWLLGGCRARGLRVGPLGEHGWPGGR
jgi:peptidoglycan/xylan/chitin deacetylase (PgdA/CDA1 family)